MQSQSNVSAVFCEDPVESSRVLNRLRSLYRPIGPSEEFLVEQMANAQWNIRRYQRTLTGLIEYQTALTAGRLELDRKQDISRTDPEIHRANTLLMGAAFHLDSRESGAQLRLHRMLLDLDRQYARALKTLLAEQARRAEAVPHPDPEQDVQPEQELEIPAGAAASSASPPHARPVHAARLGPRLVAPSRLEPALPSPAVASNSGYDKGAVS